MVIDHTATVSRHHGESMFARALSSTWQARRGVGAVNSNFGHAMSDNQLGAQVRAAAWDASTVDGFKKDHQPGQTVHGGQGPAMARRHRLVSTSPVLRATMLRAA